MVKYVSKKYGEYYSILDNIYRINFDLQDIYQFRT